MKRKKLREIEEWRWVLGYEDVYQVSDRGRVKGVRRTVIRSNGKPQTIPGRLLRPGFDKDGYRTVTLSRLGRWTEKKIHRLVAEAFLGPLPVGLQTCHIDGNKNNNRISNLKYDTPKVNTIEIIKHRMEQGKKDRRLKLTDSQVVEIRTAHANGLGGYGALARKYGVGKGTIAKIVKRKTRKHVGENGEFEG